MPAPLAAGLGEDVWHVWHVWACVCLHCLAGVCRPQTVSEATAGTALRRRLRASDADTPARLYQVRQVRHSGRSSVRPCRRRKTERGQEAKRPPGVSTTHSPTWATQSATIARLIFGPDFGRQQTKPPTSPASCPCMHLSSRPAAQHQCPDASTASRPAAFSRAVAGCNHAIPAVGGGVGVAGRSLARQEAIGLESSRAVRHGQAYQRAWCLLS